MYGSLTTPWAYELNLILSCTKKPLTTAEILEEIEKLDGNSPSPGDVYITPPTDNGNDTDADSGDEDCNDPDRLNKNQLQAETEVADVSSFVITEDETYKLSEKGNEPNASVSGVTLSFRRFG